MPVIPGTAERQTGKYQDYGGHVYNVMHPQFGATGDGVTDDTAAIQAALTAAGDDEGGIVFLPQGIYGVSTDLVVPDGVSVEGVGTGGARQSAGTTYDLGSVIKWIGGSAVVSAVMTVNLAGTKQFKSVKLRDFRIDANGQATALRMLGVGSGSKIDIVVEQFSTTGVVLDRAGGAYNVEGLEGTISAIGMANSRGVTLGYTYRSRLSIKTKLALGEVGPMARGVDLTQLVQGTHFDIDVEDAILPVDVGTGAGGGCRGNNFGLVRFNNPNQNPTNVTIGAYTGTVGFAIRTNATTNSGNSLSLLRDEEGFGRMYFDQDSGTIVAGAAGRTASFVSHDVTLPHTHVFADITDESAPLAALQAVAALGAANLPLRMNAAGTGLEFSSGPFASMLSDESAVLAAVQALGALGSALQILRVNAAGNALEFAAAAPTIPVFKGVIASKSVDQGINDSTTTKVTFDTESVDTDGAFASSTYTVPSGVTAVNVSGTLQFNAAATGVRQIMVYKNGASQGEVLRLVGGFTAGDYIVIPFDVTLPVVANDTIEIYAFHNAGAGVVVNGQAGTARTSRICIQAFS